MGSVKQRENNGQAEENAGRIFRDLGQDRAGPRPEQGIRGAGTKSETGAGFFFRQLDEDQENEDDAIEQQRDGQQSDQNYHKFK